MKTATSIIALLIVAVIVAACLISTYIIWKHFLTSLNNYLKKRKDKIK